jgi:hypothetical protein
MVEVSDKAELSEQQGIDCWFFTLHPINRLVLLSVVAPPIGWLGWKLGVVAARAVAGGL